jgi:Putative transposase
LQNKAAVYDLLFRTAAETLTTIAADPKHMDARIGLTAVLHTWGSALIHHPYVHVIVPGGGLSPDESRWITCKPGFFLPVRVLSRLFRRLFLDGLAALHKADRLVLLGGLAPLATTHAFDAALAPLRRSEWVVYAKRPFAGPQAVLAYLARYIHRVGISNSRLIALDEARVAFKWKDYRIKGRDRLKTMTLDAPISSAAFSYACCRAASTALDITACSSAWFALGILSARANCSPPRRAPANVGAPKPTAKPKTSGLPAAARAPAGG